jgi:LacI family transcriptional regulator
MKRLQDIADQVGVSRTTVSNVLHGNTKKVSKEMIRKISEILNQEGYVPNTSSRELTRKGSCIIGLCWATAVSMASLLCAIPLWQNFCLV